MLKAEPRTAALSQSLQPFLISDLIRIVYGYWAQGPYNGKHLRTRGRVPGSDQLSFPFGISAVGDLLAVADSSHNRVSVRRTTDLSLVKVLGGPAEGIANGEFHWPLNAFIYEERLYVADTGNHRVQVFSLSYDPLRQLRVNFLCKWGTEGDRDGQLRFPVGLAVIAEELFVSEYAGHRISVFRRSDGRFLRKWGCRGGGPGQFGFPMLMSISDDQQLCVVDNENNRIQVFTKDGKYLRSFGIDGDRDFTSLHGVTVVGEEVYVTAQAVFVFNLHTGQYLRRWGHRDHRGLPDDQLLSPRGIAAVGNEIFVSEYHGHRLKVFS
jgi:DNA-binding beta-propeller fold protein YncE